MADSIAEIPPERGSDIAWVERTAALVVFAVERTTDRPVPLEATCAAEAGRGHQEVESCPERRRIVKLLHRLADRLENTKPVDISTDFDWVVAATDALERTVEGATTS